MEAMAGAEPPDAVVIGGTTGGMALTEELLSGGIAEPGRYRLHGTGTVAEYVAERIGCRGPALTVSTACSSGAVALKLALELIRSGRARRVLAGGADCLCRLTYYGFSMLQLIDPEGTRPLDRNRNGMSVAEGAGMLLLEGGPVEPALAELLGAGLSCDAYHASAPHPEGAGALAAMQRALADAGLVPGAVDYVNLHGTGTRDNDAAEARALVALFGRAGGGDAAATAAEGDGPQPGAGPMVPHVTRVAELPPASSTKGCVGHSLAAAGAVEAVISILALRHGFLPPNVGLGESDPAFGIEPVRSVRPATIRTVLSNSFGFGGNNAAVAFGACETGACRMVSSGCGAAPLRVLTTACVTGAGHTAETLEVLRTGQSVAGILAEEIVTRDLPPRALRRMKRLPRITLALADAVVKKGNRPVDGVYLGTGWGPLSETWDFLEKLFGSNLEFSSPTDFVGSVHNAVAGQVAIWHKATGPNITTTCGDVSFEQALLAAQLTMSAGGSASCLIGADEDHSKLSPLFDSSVDAAGPRSDGGAALLVSREGEGPVVGLKVLARAREAGQDAALLVEAAGGAESIRSRFGAVFAGMPRGTRERSNAVLHAFLAGSGFAGAVIDYRQRTGEFASASAVACAWAVAEVADPMSRLACGKGILLLGLGETLSAVEVLP